MSMKPGWYIVNALSGSEKKVANAIREQAEKKSLSHLFDQIFVPVERINEIKRGQKINSERKIFPGYVLVKMIMDERTWHLVKNIPKVNGFLGTNGKPQEISEKEVESIFQLIEESSNNSKNIITYNIGESVKVTDGPFESFIGIVDEVDSEKNRLKVAVSIFGRSTPVELEYSQVTKIN